MSDATDWLTLQWLVWARLPPKTKTELREILEVSIKARRAFPSKTSLLVRRLSLPLCIKNSKEIGALKWTKSETKQYLKF